jgi:hypothetical protein
MSKYEVAEVQGDDHRPAVEAAKRRLQENGRIPDDSTISYRRVSEEGVPPTWRATVHAKHK